MVKKIIFFVCALTTHLCATVITVNVSSGAVLTWDDYSFLGTGDTLNIVITPTGGNAQLLTSNGITVPYDIECNGDLRLTCNGHTITSNASVTAQQLILEAEKIVLNSTSILDVSSASGSGTVFVGGGWLGGDPNIHNADIVLAMEGSQIFADAQTNGPGGTVVLWSQKATGFEGAISATGMGGSNPGGQVEISSNHFLVFDGTVDVSAQSGISGDLFLDPVSITIQTANPDINGNGGNLDITSVTQLNNATTTPTGFPNASSIITAGALSALLTNNVNMTLAAQNFITFNAALTPPGTNVTLTLSAPTINLNEPITLASGGTLTGSGVTTINVGPAGNIQNAVDLSQNGTAVNLASATYVGQVVILNKSITLNGNGIANTSLIPPTPPTALPLHSGRNPIIFVQGGTDTVIQNLTVDAMNFGFPTNANIIGIFFVNGGSTVSNVHVTQVANSVPPYGGGQQGIGVRSDCTVGGPFTLNVTNSLFDFFQKGAIVGNGSVLTVDISNNTINGLGVPSTPAANGLQISSGATGTVSDNSISGIIFANHMSSTGMLLFATGPNLLVSGNSVDNNDEGIISLSSAAGMVIENNTVTNNGDGGISVVDDAGDTQILSNTLTHNGGLAGPTGFNSGIYLFSSVNQPFEVNQNTITPAPGTSGIFTQGNMAGFAPNATFLSNIFIDP